MIMIRIFIVKFTSRLNIWAMTINGALCRARHKVLLLPKPLALMDDLGELLPHLPTLSIRLRYKTNYPQKLWIS
jgi:hypothetical protein